MIGDSHTLHESMSWKYAFIGGMVSIPLTVVVHMKTGSGIEFSSGTMVVGGGAAGYLAERDSARARTTGALAGAVGGLPLLWWWSSTVQYIPIRFVPVWPDAASQVAYLAVIGLVVFFGSVLAGWLGGRLGGWVSKRVSQVKTFSTKN